MARRLFNSEIICSEEFLDMPVSSRDLYCQLCIRADDDGFIQPKITMRTIGATGDDLKVLITKRFLLPFDSGVVVIKHWLIHNMIRSDRYKPTRFLEEKNSLFIKENKAYTDNPDNGKKLLATKRQPVVAKMLPQVKLSKDKIKVVGQADSSISGKILNSLIKEYHDMVKANKGYEAKTTAGDIKNLKTFLLESSESEVKAIFKWYIVSEKFKEFPNLSSAISAHSVNLFRGQQNRTW